MSTFTQEQRRMLVKSHVLACREIMYEIFKLQDFLMDSLSEDCAAKLDTAYIEAQLDELYRSLSSAKPQTHNAIDPRERKLK